MSAFIYKLALAFLEYKRNEKQLSSSPVGVESGGATNGRGHVEDPCVAPVSGEAFQQESLATYLKWLRCSRKVVQLGRGFCMRDDLLVLRCEHWLEAADDKHRYGSNLRPYFDFWVNKYNEGLSPVGSDGAAAAAASPAEADPAPAALPRIHDEVDGELAQRRSSSDDSPFLGFNAEGHAEEVGDLGVCDLGATPERCSACNTALPCQHISLADGLAATIAEDRAVSLADGLAASITKETVALVAVTVTGGHDERIPTPLKAAKPKRALPLAAGNVSARRSARIPSLLGKATPRQDGPPSPAPSPATGTSPLSMPMAATRPKPPITSDAATAHRREAGGAPAAGGGGNKGEPAGGWQKVLEVVAAAALQRRKSSASLRRMGRRAGQTRSSGGFTHVCSGNMCIHSTPVTPAQSAHDGFQFWPDSCGLHRRPHSQRSAHHARRTGPVNAHSPCGCDSRPPVGSPGADDVIQVVEPLERGWHQYSCPNLEALAGRRGRSGGSGDGNRSSNECLSDLDDTFSMDGEPTGPHQSAACHGSCSAASGCEPACTGSVTASAGTTACACSTCDRPSRTPLPGPRDKQQLSWCQWQSVNSCGRTHTSWRGSPHGVRGSRSVGGSETDDGVGDRYHGGDLGTDDDSDVFSWGSDPPDTPPCSEAEGEEAYDLKKLSRLNFFAWLDYGEGKDLDLSGDGVPRSKLESERVRYLSPEELPHYEVVVNPTDGTLRYRMSGELLHTFAPGCHPPGCSHAAADGAQAGGGAGHTAQPVKDDGPGERRCDSGAAARPDAVVAPADRAHADADAANADGDRKEVQKWIWVLDPAGRLYVAAKIRGQFHHSSFLRGAAVMAAGNLLACHGHLTKLTADSGHYWPSPGHFKYAYELLESRGADMSGLAGLEFRTKH